MIPKPPSLEILTEIAKRWNERHPIGTPVTRYRLIDPLEDPMETRTRSIAWVVGGHSVLVSVEGVSGGVLLDSVTVKQATDGVLTQ